MVAQDNLGDQAGLIMVSEEAANFAFAHLSKEDQATIEAFMDVKRGVITSATVYMLAEAIELSPGATKELSEKLVAETRSGDPDRHQRVNQLLGRLTHSLDPNNVEFLPGEEKSTLLGLQSPNGQTPELAPQPPTRTTPRRARPTAKRTAEPEIVDITQVRRERMGAFLSDVFQTEIVPGHYDMTTLIKVTNDLLDLFSTLKGKGLNDKRKAAQIQRLSMWLGLEGDPLSSAEIAKQTGLSSASTVNQGYHKAVGSVQRIAPKELAEIKNAFNLLSPNL